MPRSRPKYTGPRIAPPRYFSPALTERLEQLHREHVGGEARSDQDQQAGFASPIQAYFSEILTAAGWAWDELPDGEELTKPEIRAEIDDLVAVGAAYERKLRTMSPEVDRSFGTDANPLGLADAISEFLAHAPDVRSHPDKLPEKSRFVVAQHQAAQEMAIRVLRVLRDHGLKISATGNDGHDRASYAVATLQAIGDDMGLRLQISTWRDIVAEAKKSSLV